MARDYPRRPVGNGRWMHSIVLYMSPVSLAGQVPRFSAALATATQRKITSRTRRARLPNRLVATTRNAARPGVHGSPQTTSRPPATCQASPFGRVPIAWREPPHGPAIRQMTTRCCPAVQPSNPQPRTAGVPSTVMGRVWVLDPTAFSASTVTLTSCGAFAGGVPVSFPVDGSIESHPGALYIR